MVKECSPFEPLGVVDSSFKRPGGSASELLEAAKTHRLRQGELRSPAAARSLPDLERSWRSCTCLPLYYLTTDRVCCKQVTSTLLFFYSRMEGG